MPSCQHPVSSPVFVGALDGHSKQEPGDGYDHSPRWIKHCDCCGPLWINQTLSAIVGRHESEIEVTAHFEQVDGSVSYRVRRVVDVVGDINQSANGPADNVVDGVQFASIWAGLVVSWVEVNVEKK